MRVLVTGNLGYVGQVAQGHLATLRHEIVGVDCGLFVQKWIDVLQPAQFIGDIRYIEKHHLLGFDAIVHLAAVSNDPTGQEFEAATDEINRATTIRLARLAHAAGVKRFVFASSCTVYGMDGLALKNEEWPTNPLTAYANSKRDAEKGVSLYADGQMQVTCLRFATACGASPALRLDLVLNDFVASAVTRGRIEVLSDGTPWRPLIAVSDMARAIEWALQRDGEQYQIVNVGSAEWQWQIGELAEKVGQFMGVPMSVNSKAEHDRRSYRVDFSLFKSLAPDHQPIADFERTVFELGAQIANLELEPDFRKGKYARLYALRALMAQGKIDQNLRAL